MPCSTAKKLSAGIGKPVRIVDIPPEAGRQSMTKSGMPPVLIDALLDLLAATKANKLAALADGVFRVTGRQPASFDVWAQRHANAFR